MKRKQLKHSSNPNNRPGWRDYQSELQRQSGGRRFLGRGRGGVVLFALLAVALFLGLHTLMHDGAPPEGSQAVQAASPPQFTAGSINKEDIRQLLDKEDFNNLTQKDVELTAHNQVLHVETSLDVDMQNYLLDKMDREHSRYIGIVVMEADTGRVLAMAGFDKTDGSVNPCLCSKFPSASIFKIVTAASAVDHCGYTPESKFHFNGGKYTLYKRQLRDRINSYTNTVSFKQAFAESVDPVFGKIGEHHLGKPMLVKYATSFGFNEPLNFDLPVNPSHFKINDKPYHWAELASGFNRDTTISPLHGAVIASAVLNEGRMVTPSIVDRIVDDKGRVLYTGQQSWEQRAMSSKAAAVLNQLMQATIKSGTGRKSFRNYRHDKVLSRLQIGGKTGTIDNHAHDARYDWFVGFGKERDGKKEVVVAVMVAHEKYIGIRASQYARMAMKYYFSNLP
jgi:peptidoglycan glycosyltransferase